MRSLLLIVAACGGSTVAPSAPTTSGSAVPEATVEQREPEPAPAKPINAHEAEKAAMQFLHYLDQSRADIARCWDAARAKDAKLRGVSLPMTIAASFDATGTLVSMTFDPSISPDFEACVKPLGNAWQMTLTQKMSFKGSLTLGS
jgi:hypothetical protein